MQVWAGLVPLRPLALAWGRRPLPVSSRGPSLCIRVLTASSHKDTVLWGQGQLGDSFDLNPLCKDSSPLPATFRGPGVEGFTIGILGGHGSACNGGKLSKLCESTCLLENKRHPDHSPMRKLFST